MGIFKSIGRWAKRRAVEGSTLGGVSLILAGIVGPKLGLPLDQTAQIIATVLGGVLAGATTTKPPLESDRDFSG